MSTTTKVSSGGGKKAVKPTHNPKVVSYKEIEERANAVDRAIDDRLLQCRLLTIDLQEEERVRQSREAAILKRDLEEIVANGGNLLCGNVLSIKTITPSIINLSFMYLLHKTSIDNAFEFYPVEAYNENFNIDCDLPTLFQVFGESLFPGIHSNDEIRRVAKDLFNASMEFHHGEGNISSSFYYDDIDRVFSVTPKGNVWFNNRCPGLVDGWVREYRQEIRMRKERALAKKKKHEELQMQKELQEELQKGVQLQEELENVTRFREELENRLAIARKNGDVANYRRIREDLDKLEKAKSLESVKEEYEVEAEEDGNIIYGWIQTLDGDSEEE